MHLFRHGDMTGADKPRSYVAAKAEIAPGLEHRQPKGLNNRSEAFHRHTRRREKIMGRFRSDTLGRQGKVHLYPQTFTVEVFEHVQQPERAAVLMDTDQGSQFTSFDWTDRLKRAKTKITMDGKARYRDNIFIERLWRFLKYECVCLHAWEAGSQAKAGVGSWITFYNHLRPHAAHSGQPPAVVYFKATETDQKVQAVA